MLEQAAGAVRQEVRARAMNAVLGKIADRALGWVIPENAAAAGTVSCTPSSSRALGRVPVQRQL
jgi:hypothetical protein